MLTPNTVLQNRYQVVKQLGQGGMGAVYQAVDQRFGSTVALKETLVSGEQLRRAFEREARLLNTLQHAALPHVIDYFFEGDGQFLVMQYIPGDDLGQMLRRRAAPFPVEDVLAWADQLLDLLDYLHTHEPPIVHRDIKPENLKLTKRGNVILLDFGLAKGLAEQAAATQGAGSIVGYTPNYAPLEQIRGTGTDARSDLYSLAATLYHLLTAELPPDALNRAESHIHGQPDPLRSVDRVNPGVPPGVAYAILTAMRLRRDERPASAAAMRKMLREAGAAIPARPQPPPPAATQVVGSGAAATTPAGRPTSPGGFPTTPEYQQQPQPTVPVTPQPAAAPPAAGSTAKIVAVAGGGALLVALLAGAAVAVYFAMRPSPVPQAASQPGASTPGASTPDVSTPDAYTPPPARDLAPPAGAPPAPTPPAPAAGPAIAVRVSASASSVRAPIGSTRYVADYAVDGRSDTAWVEGGAGPGIGESITLDLSAPARVARLRIEPGYFKSGQVWAKNNRLALVSLRLSDGRVLRPSFADAMRAQTVEIGGGPISSITLTIEDAYLGGDDLDTAVSEIAVEVQ